MAHDHIFVDDDNRFVIDGLTRQLTNVTGNKPAVMQFDHNSETLTFQMPRNVEGHDMLKCDRIEIHYTNAGKGTSASTRPTAASIDTIKDLATSPEDENLLTFSWTIGRNATQYAGTLTFQFKFICNGETENSLPAFVWHSGQYSFVEVLASLNITDEIIEAYPDVLASLSAKVDEFDKTITSYDQSIEDLETNKLDSTEAAETYATKKEVENLKTDNSLLESVNEEIKTLKTGKLDATAAAETYATVENLDSTNTDVQNLRNTHNAYEQSTADNLKAIDSEIENLKSVKMDSTVAAEIYETKEQHAAHNTDQESHSDIRLLIDGLTSRLNALADSDDTTLDQMSEVVAYIKSNKDLIEAVTTNKVSVADIINNLTTNVANKPLSAAQGVALKALIDALQTSFATHTENKSNPHGVTAAQLGLGNAAQDIETLKTGKLDSTAAAETYATKKEVEDLKNDTSLLESVNQEIETLKTSKLDSTAAAETYVTKENLTEHNTNTEAHNDIRLVIEGLTSRLNTLANSDDTTLDQMSEVVAYIKSNKSLIDAVTTGKVSVADIIDNLTTNVANKPLSAAQGVALKAAIDALATSKLDSSVAEETYATKKSLTQVTEEIETLKTDKLDSSVAEETYATKESLTEHIDSKSNPHEVTADQIGAVTYKDGRLYRYGEDLLSDHRTIVTCAATDDLYVLHFDSSVYNVKANALMGRWIIVNGQRAYVGSNSPDSMILYTDITATVPLFVTCEVGTVIYPADVDVIEDAGLVTEDYVDGGISELTILSYDSETKTLVQKGDDLCPESRTLTVTDITNGFYVWIDSTKHTLKSSELKGRVVVIDGQKYYVGENSTNCLIVYTDAALQYVPQLTYTDGMLVYPSDNVTDEVRELLGIDEEEVSGIVNTALAEAKASGEFDGEKGDTGPQGPQGEKGDTGPQGSKGEKGDPGTDGKSAYEYAQDGGYLGTEAEFAEDINPDNIKEDVNANAQTYIATELAKREQLTPEYANSVEECTDTTKVYILPDGFIYGYMPFETVGGVGYTNLVPTSTDTDGSIYNSTGYKDNARLSSSGGVSSAAQTGSVTTGFIPYKYGDVIRMKGAEWLGATAKYNGHYYIISYDSNKTVLDGVLSAQSYSDGTWGTGITYDESTGVTTFSFNDSNSSSTIKGCWANAAYFRINAYGKGADLIVTVNEEIEEASTITEYRWANTGHAFVPADYEDLIVANKTATETNAENIAKNTSAIQTLNAQVDAILEGEADISAAAKFDPTVYDYLPVLYLTGDTSPIAESKDNKVTLDYVYGDMSGTCTLKGQGATSYKMAKAFIDAGKAGKFNYTIKFDTAFEAADGWGEQQKYCLKANWIDHSHSRNVVSAKLWGLIAKSRSNIPAEFSALPNAGAVDGFPIVIVLNDEFHGLYTFNIPKDGWMFGLTEDTTKTQAMLGANDHELATQFKGELAGDESDFELEFASNEDDVEWVTTSLNRLINACINSDGTDLDTTVAQYLDWESVIDYYIWTVVCKGTDMVDKNYLLVTLDGTKWYFSAYDMDSTYGLEWDASGLTRAVSNISFEECASTHRAYELIKQHKTDALKARYAELRENILSETRICQYFENFAWNIPSPVALEDVKKYPTIRGSSVNGIDQICRWVRQRLEKVDEWASKL